MSSRLLMLVSSLKDRASSALLENPEKTAITEKDQSMSCEQIPENMHNGPNNNASMSAQDIDNIANLNVNR